MTSCHILIDHISKYYLKPGMGRREFVLNNISLSIRRGEFFAIVGPSGCGKTTLLNIIGGQLKASSGTVTVAGVTVSRPTRTCLSVFQEHALFPWRTVEENISYGLELFGYSVKQGRQIVDQYLELGGLRDARNKRVTELSGGMRQKVQLARTLALEPEVLLMDEPFGALDSITKDLLNSEFERIWGVKRPTVILVTHDVHTAVSLADRVAVMSNQPGQIAELIDVSLPRPRRDVHRNLSMAVRAVCLGYTRGLSSMTDSRQHNF